MNTLLLTPNSSVKSSTTTTTTTAATTMEDGNWSETPDNNNSCYFPGCRKDTNCNCDICLASINATLDLIQRSSLTKLSASKPPPRSPVTFDPSFPDAAMSTPRFSRPRRVEVSPPLNFTARMSFHEKVKRKKREIGFGVVLMRSVMVLSLIFAAEFGFSWMVFKVLQPELSPDIVRNLGVKSWGLQDLNERMKYLNNEMKGLVGVKVSNRSSVDFVWEIIQDGLLLNSRCTLYKSVAEEVSIWGWPLQTAGLLTTEFSSRSFTILSGRVTEWSNGKLKYSIRKANSSWKQGKWSSSIVNFDQNTWILEYKRSSMIQNARLVSAALEFLKFRMKREVQNIKQEFWMLSAFGNRYSGFTEDSFRFPT